MCCVPTRRLVTHRNLLAPSAVNGSTHSRDKRTAKCSTYKKREAFLNRGPFVAVAKSAAADTPDQRPMTRTTATASAEQKNADSVVPSAPAVSSSTTLSGCPSTSTSSSHLSENCVRLERQHTPQTGNVTPLEAKHIENVADGTEEAAEAPDYLAACPAPILSNGALLSAAISPDTPPRKKRRRIRKKLPPGLTAKKNERQFVVHDYHDHAMDDPKEYLKALDEEEHHNKANHHQVKMCGGPGNSGGVTIPFPFRLHKLLEQIDMDGYSSVISWQPHGRAFKIHNKDAFVSDIMPRYFNQSKLTSFQRQLNLYGFIRLSRGEDTGGYYHELFLKNMPFLCHKMIRTKCKGTGFKAASDPDAEPNFYSMPHVTHHKDYWKKDVPATRSKSPETVQASKKKQVKTARTEPKPTKKVQRISEDVAKARVEDMYLTALKQAKQGREQEAFRVDPRINPKGQTYYPLSRNNGLGTLGPRKTSLPLMCFDFQDSKNVQGQYMPPVPGSVMPPPQPFLDPLAIAASSSVAGGLTSADLPLDFLTAWDDQQPTLMYGNGAAAIDPYVAATQSQPLDLADDFDYEPLPLVSPETRNFRAALGNIVGRPYKNNDLTLASVNPSWSLDGLELPFPSNVGPATPQNSEEDADILDKNEPLNVIDDDDSVIMQAIMRDDMLSELNKDDALGSLDNDEELGHVLDFLVQ